MSKKNNKSIKARAHAHDLLMEQRAREKLAKQAHKNAAKAERRVERAVAAGGVAKKHKKKAFRIRKGVQIKGIKVVDSDSKKKLLRLLKAEQAAKMMDADGPGAGSSGSSGAKKVKKAASKAKVKVAGAKKGAKAKAGGEEGGQGQGRPAAMET